MNAPPPPAPAAAVHDQSLTLALLSPEKAASPQSTTAPAAAATVSHLWGFLGDDPAKTTTQNVLQTRTRDHVLGLLQNSTASHVALWSDAYPQGIALPRAEAISKLESTTDAKWIVMPLPGTDAEKWPQIMAQANAMPSVTRWLTSNNEAQVQERLAKRQAEQEKERENREKVGQTFYQFLLGDPKTKNATSPATQASP